MARPLEFLQQPPAQADPIRKQGDGRPGLRQSAILFLLLIILMCCLYIGRTCLYVLQVDRNAWLTVRWKDDLPLTGLLELFIRNNPNETNGSVTPPQPPEWLMNIENEVIEKARRAPLVDLSFLAFDSKTATTTPNGGDMRAFELATLPNSSADPYFFGSGFNSISTPEGCASRTAPTSSVSMANKPCVNETNREMKLFSNDDPWWNALHHLWPKIHKSIFYRDVIFEELRSRVFLMPMGRMIAHCDNHLHNIPNRRKDFNWIPPTVLKVRKKKRRKNHRNAQRVIMRNSIVLRASLSDLLKLPRGEVCIVMMRHSMRPFSYLLERGPWESATERWTHGDVGDEEDFRIESYHMPILVTIKNVFISSRGQVYGEDIGLIWYKGLCPRFLPKNMLPQAAQSYNKIFVISQDTGNYVYHALTEDYPRVAAYYQELLKDDSIMIHVVEEHRDMLSKLFALLGIHSRRLIHGNAFGGTVFWPESSYECVLGSRWHVRKMRSITRLTLEKKYPTIFVQGSLSPPPLFQHVFSDHQAADVKSNAPIRWPANPNRPPTQPGLVISRTKRRRVRNEADIIRMLYEWYPTYSFEVFSDNPIPSIEETYYLFYYARIIIAPHGAGLANMIVSPGAGVPLVQNSEQAKLIEFRGSSPAPCFEHLAASLGVEYFRLHPKKNHGLFGDMTVDLVSLRDLLVHAIGPPPG